MRSLVLAIISLLFCTLASAQTAVVRTGEHEGFTRIVVPVPDVLKWNVRNLERSLVLSVQSKKLQFDVSSVFDRISRSRVLEISQPVPGADLVVRLACDCEVSSFRASRSLIAIDVASPTKKDPKGELAMPVVFEKTSATQFERSSNSDETGSAGDPGRDLQTRDDVQVPHHVTFTVTKQRLVEQLDRASQQGVLVFDEAKADSSDKIENFVKTHTPADIYSQVSAVTVLDQGLRTSVQDTGNSYLTECISDNTVNLLEWSDGSPFFEQLQVLRTDLYGEFDNKNGDVMSSLAKLYLYYGFGGEAEQVVHLMEDPSLNGDLLIAISRILDGSPKPERSPLEGQQHCSGRVALWSTLSERRLSGDVNLNAVQRAFSSLPSHLRFHLGARLTKIMVDGGRPDVGQSIIDSAVRNSNVVSPEIDITHAAIKFDEGDFANSLESSEKAASVESDQSAHALISKIKIFLKTEDTPSQADIELMEALLLEFRGTSIHMNLREAIVLAYAMVGKFGDALPLWGLMRREIDKSKETEMLSHLIPLVTELADDIVFLDYVLKHKGDVSSMSNTVSVLGTAKRLMDLGFPAPAREILLEVVSQDFGDARRMMLAEAALAEGKPHKALVDVLGITGSAADKVRISAMWQNKNYSEAASLAAEARDNERAARGFFLSGDYEAIPEDSTRFIKAGGAAKRLINSSLPELPPLEQARALLNESAVARGDIAQLLDETELSMSE